MRFYPWDELGGQYDNWWGPNTQCLTDMTRAAGFVSTDLLYRDGTAALLKAHRCWQHPPPAPTPSLMIREVANTVRLDRKLERRGRFALLSIWVEGLPLEITREEVRVEVGGYGSAPVYIELPIDSSADENVRLNRLTPASQRIEPALRRAAQQFVQAVAPVPPGLKPGQHSLQVFYRDQWSEAIEITLVENSHW